jgi:hypothetical protein
MIQLKVVLINILTAQIYLSIINHVSGDAVYFYPFCIKASFKS